MEYLIVSRLARLSAFLTCLWRGLDLLELEEGSCFGSSRSPVLHRVAEHQSGSGRMNVQTWSSPSSSSSIWYCFSELPSLGEIMLAVCSVDRGD